MTKFIFIVDPARDNLNDTVGRILYYMYNNRSATIATTKQMQIDVVQNMVEINKLTILEGDKAEVFCHSRQNVISKPMFELLTPLVAKLNNAKIQECDIHIIT